MEVIFIISIIKCIPNVTVSISEGEYIYVPKIMTIVLDKCISFV